MTLGQRIRAAREGADLSQIKLSSLLGINQTTLSKWERGANEGPGLTHGLRICEACNVSLLWLATGLPPAFEAAA